MARSTVAAVLPDSPAAGKLAANDRIIAIEGQPVDSVDQLREAIGLRQGQPTRLTVEHGTETQEVTLTPRLDSEIGPDQGRVGINLEIQSADLKGTRYVNPIRNPLTAIGHGIAETVSLFGQMLGGLAALVGSLFGLAPAPAGGVAGPIGITRLTGTIAQKGGILSLARWTALLSVNLALINLLPLPALDGSRIVFALVEWVRGKRVPPQREALVHAVGMMVLLGLMLLITFTDVRNWITGLDAFGG